MKITFLRHTEVIESYIGKYNGHIDIPISTNGKLKAKKLSKQMKDNNFDKIYCSDLIRAKDTLKAFDLDIKPIYTSSLREKSWGKYEGKSFSDIEKDGIKYLNFKQWLSQLDGENIDEYKKNVDTFFHETLLKDKATNILVVTHSGFIKTLISILNNISLEDAFCQKLSYLDSFVYQKK